MSMWTKTIYILLFLFLIVEPHIFQGHIFSFSSAYLQSLSTFIVFGIAYGIYFIHTRDIKEKLKLNKEVLSREEQLVDNYKYIGVLNRRVPLLHEITTGVLSRNNVTKNQKKETFDELLTLATVSVGKSKKGLFRFVHSQNFHTVKEFQLSSDTEPDNFQKVSNKQIISLLTEKQVHTVGDQYILGSSEKNSSVKCVYILSPSELLDKDQVLLLQAIVDQAQLLYSHLYVKSSPF